MEGVDFQLKIPPTFQGKIWQPFDRLPYFVPRLTASSIRTYSVSGVPYRLLLAPVIQPPSEQGATP